MCFIEHGVRSNFLYLMSIVNTFIDLCDFHFQNIYKMRGGKITELPESFSFNYHAGKSSEIFYYNESSITTELYRQ